MAVALFVGKRLREFSFVPGAPRGAIGNPGKRSVIFSTFSTQQRTGVEIDFRIAFIVKGDLARNIATTESNRRAQSGYMVRR